jgi:hypothetical protein
MYIPTAVAELTIEEAVAAGADYAKAAADADHEKARNVEVHAKAEKIDDSLVTAVNFEGCETAEGRRQQLRPAHPTDNFVCDDAGQGQNQQHYHHRHCKKFSYFSESLLAFPQLLFSVSEHLTLCGN